MEEQTIEKGCSTHLRATNHVSRRELLKASFILGAMPLAEAFAPTSARGSVLAEQDNCPAICDILQEFADIPEIGLMGRILVYISRDILPSPTEDEVRSIWNQGKALDAEVVALLLPYSTLLVMEIDDTFSGDPFVKIPGYAPCPDYDEFLRRVEALGDLVTDGEAISPAQVTGSPVVIVLKKLLVATGLDLYADIIVEINGALVISVGDLIRDLIAALRAGQLRGAYRILRRILGILLDPRGPFINQLRDRLVRRFGRTAGEKLLKRILGDLISRIGPLFVAILVYRLAQAIVAEL